MQEFLVDPGVTVLDRRETQRADLSKLRHVPAGEESADPGCWVYYPWRRTMVGTLGPDALRLLRLDRNRNKITFEEQEGLRGLRVGVVGLSVGHAIAHTLALEGLCGELRLADFDVVEVSNLNRIPATLLDLDVNKAVVAARRIAELDPYLDVQVFPDGVTPTNVEKFLDGLDVLIEECDSLDLKVVLREEARRRRIPVLMETSDRGLFDVERFDLEPDRPVLHGLLGDIDSAGLATLSAEDKVPHVLRILGATHLSSRAAASMVEVGRSLNTWPQLAGDVALGGATVAAAVRRLGTGRPLPSGRVRVDLDERLDSLVTSAEHRAASHGVAALEGADPAGTEAGTFGLQYLPGLDEHPAIPAVLEAIALAPSGGNVQPWRVETGPAEVRLYLDPGRTTTMDVEYRGSYVALGAALFNARAAASACDALGPVSVCPDPRRPDLVGVVHLEDGSDDDLTRHYAGVGRRGTNRHFGHPQPLSTAASDCLQAAATREGGRVHLVVPGPELEVAGSAMAAADRIRFLTTKLHEEMFSELVWPEAPADVGIEVGTLGMNEADLAKLSVVSRPEVMALLAEWDAGEALGEDTRHRVASSSALAVVTVEGRRASDFVRGGSAVEAVWIAAEAQGLAVHPMSPVFLFAVSPPELTVLSERFAEQLAAGQAAFRQAAQLEGNESVALVLRLSHTEVKPTRSRRRPIVASRTTT